MFAQLVPFCKLVPGGGAQWLPRLVGRSRALEIVLSSDDFDADIAERCGWVNRTLDDDDLDSFVDNLVRRLATTLTGEAGTVFTLPKASITVLRGSVAGLEH